MVGDVWKVSYQMSRVVNSGLDREKMKSLNCTVDVPQLAMWSRTSLFLGGSGL